MSRLHAAALLAIATVSCHALHAAIIPKKIDLARQSDRVVVTLDGQPFTEYVFQGHAKPILFPILGPGGVGMTRSWPMVEGVAGEPHDHPHHESLWFMHGNVNGVDFWMHKPDAAHDGATPRVEQTEIVRSEGGPTGILETRNRWLAADGTVVCTDTRRITFAGDEHARTIDYAITIHADHGELLFGDTKEGTMAIRVHPALQSRDKNGSQGAAGTIVNSEGQRNDDAWGQPARWVDYSGPIPDADGTPRHLGIAVFDHPHNLRHPTRWHARDYGLFAANPFGVRDFTAKGGQASGAVVAGGPPRAGDYRLAAGDSLTLRYLFIFHEGGAADARLEERFRDRHAGDDTK